MSYFVGLNWVKFIRIKELINVYELYDRLYSEKSVFLKQMWSWHLNLNPKGDPAMNGNAFCKDYMCRAFFLVTQGSKLFRVFITFFSVKCIVIFYNLLMAPFKSHEMHEMNWWGFIIWPSETEVMLDSGNVWLMHKLGLHQGILLPNVIEV